jgi:outer membrane protease
MLFAAAVALVTARTAGAQEFSLTTSSGTGVMLGVAREFVYSGSYVVSELDWPLLPAVFVGAALDMTTGVGFIATLEAQAAVPTPSGTMTDSDFLNGDGVKTHYSQSDTTLTGAVILSAQAGWAIPLPVNQPITLLAFFLQFEFMQFNFAASNGYLQYPPAGQSSPNYTPWSPSTPKVPIYGTGIIYTQNYLIPALGLKGSVLATDNLTVNFSVAFSPYLWCFDIDTHIFRYDTFYDSLRGGLMIEPRLSAALRITPRATLSLDALYRHISGLTGDTTAVGMGVPGTGGTPVIDQPPGQATSYPNSAGASFDAVSISVVLSYRL